MSTNIDFYPEGCPPSDANCHSGYIYLFIKNNPPNIHDTRTAYEKNRRPDAEPCIRRALSCGIDQSYLDSMSKLFPLRKRGGWYRAKAHLNDCGDGVLKQTGNNSLHYSLWLDITKKLNFHNSLEVI